MVRTVITPENTCVQLIVPQEYVGKEIEVTFLALDELAVTKREKGTMANFWGTMSDETAKILHKDVEQSRSEWERDI